MYFPNKICDKEYIGQTKTRLEKRLYQHQYNINIGNKNHSALCDHVISTGHTPNWEDTQILKRENHYKKRDIHEMICIKTTPNLLNKQTDSMFLSNAYRTLIETWHYLPAVLICQREEGKKINLRWTDRSKWYYFCVFIYNQFIFAYICMFKSSKLNMYTSTL